MLEEAHHFSLDFLSGSSSNFSEGRRVVVTAVPVPFSFVTKQVAFLSGKQSPSGEESEAGELAGVSLVCRLPASCVASYPSGKGFWYQLSGSFADEEVHSTLIVYSRDPLDAFHQTLHLKFLFQHKEYSIFANSEE